MAGVSPRHGGSQRSTPHLDVVAAVEPRAGSLGRFNVLARHVAAIDQIDVGAPSVISIALAMGSADPVPTTS